MIDPNILLLLESTLINEESPDYIEVSEGAEGYIYILLSKKEYKNIPLYERIMRVNALLEFDHDDILSQHPVLIECLDETELSELFALYGKTNE